MTIEEIKKNHSLAEVARNLGLKVKKTSGTESIKCPNPTHNDKKPSCVLMHDINRFKCKSCGVTGDIIDLFQLVTGCSKKEAINSIEPSFFKEKFTPSKEITPQEYIEQRKITPETIKKFDIRILIDKIVYPIPTGYKIRLFGKGKDKWKTTAGTKECLFKTQEASSEVILCEGEIDSIKLWQETKLPVWTTTAGAGSFNEQFVSEFLHLKKIYIAYDNDKPGKDGAEKVADILGRDRCFFVNVPEHAGKDWCDFFKWGYSGNDFKKLLVEAEWGLDKFSIINWKKLLTLKFPEQEWLIEKFLPRTGFTLLVGEEASGKSFLSLNMAKCLIEKTKFLGQFEVFNSPKILFIDKENGLRRIQRRLKGMKCKPSSKILFLKHPSHFTLENQSFIEYVTKYVEDNKVRIIVIDSLIDILTGNENDSKDIAVFFNDLRKISSSICWLIIHHSNKPVFFGTRNISQRTRGSSNIIAQVDNQFYLERNPKNPKLFTIAQGKSRDFEPLPKIEIEFKSSEDGKNMEEIRYLGEVKDEIKKAEEAKENVLSVVKQTNNLTKKEIYQEVLKIQRVSFNTINKQIILLEKDMFINGKGKPKRYYFVPEEKPKNNHTNGGLF